MPAPSAARAAPSGPWPATRSTRPACWWPCSAPPDTPPNTPARQYQWDHRAGQSDPQHVSAGRPRLSAAFLLRRWSITRCYNSAARPGKSPLLLGTVRSRQQHHRARSQRAGRRGGAGDPDRGFDFATVPANLRQQVTIKINAEIYSQASSLFGFGPATTNVLAETFDASALVGNIITAGNLVTTSNAGGLDISASTFTYTPYLLMGSGGPDIGQDQLITGTPYQEIYTNFPLGSQILTGLFLGNRRQRLQRTQQASTPTHCSTGWAGGAAGQCVRESEFASTPAPALTRST